jgi:hypothetical protein
MILGSCPYCNDGLIEIREKLLDGKKVKLFACSNAHWTTEDGEMFELSKDSRCGFRIWQNALSRYGKWFHYAEIKNLLKDGEVEVELISKKYKEKISYKKKVLLDEQYGVSVLWES